MTRHRSLRTTNSQVSAHAPIAGPGAATKRASTFPRVLGAGLIFLALAGPGLSPGAHAQNTQPVAGTPIDTAGPPKKQKPVAPPAVPYRMTRAQTTISPEAAKWVSSPLDVERYLNSLRTAPFRAIDPRSYGNAIRQRDRMPAPSGGKNSPFASQQPLAPYTSSFSGAPLRHFYTSNIPRFNIADSTGSWFPMGPYRRFPAPDALDQGELPVGGRVSGVAYANDGSGIFYIATASGGVWKWDPNSVDNVPIAVPGLDDTWTHYSDSQFPTLETSCVAVDPTDHRIAYVGMGDYDGTGATANLQGNTQVVQ